MKRVLVSGYIGFNNFGDEAIFYALSNHLKEKNVVVSALTSSKKETKEKYDVEVYNFKNPSEILKGILSCDFLFSGGGSLLQNKTSSFSLIYYLFIILLAKMFFKKVIIFAQGIEPIKGKFFEFITKTVLKTCDFISVRDLKSQELLKSWKIKSTLLSDPVYSILQDRKINENKKGLIVQLRSFEGINEKFLSDLAQSISKSYQGEIKVLSLQEEYDKNLCLEFIKKLEENNLKAEFINPKTIEETIEIINSVEFIISTRLHGLICSSALKTKSFALIYDDKIKTLCDELNLQSIEIKNYKKENLAEKLIEFFNNKTFQANPYRRFSWDYIDNILN